MKFNKKAKVLLAKFIILVSVPSGIIFNINSASARPPQVGNGCYRVGGDIVAFNTFAIPIQPSYSLANFQGSDAQKAIDQEINKNSKNPSNCSGNFPLDNTYHRFRMNNWNPGEIKVLTFYNTNANSYAYIAIAACDNVFGHGGYCVANNKKEWSVVKDGESYEPYWNINGYQVSLVFRNDPNIKDQPDSSQYVSIGVFGQ